MARIKPKTNQKELSFLKKLIKDDVPDNLELENSKVTKQILKDLKDNDVETDLLILGVEINATEIDDLVPDEFPSSTKVVDEIEVQKTWGEYCTKGRKRLNENGNKYLLSFGVFDDNGNTYMMTWEQAKLYYDNVSGTLLSPSEFLELLQSAEYTFEVE